MERVSETIGREKFQAGRTKGSLNLINTQFILLFSGTVTVPRKNEFTVKAHIHDTLTSPYSHSY